MKEQTKLKICRTCLRAIDENDFYDFWKDKDYKDCSECRRDKNTERVRRYRDKKKIKQSNVKINPLSVERYIISNIPSCQCFHCNYRSYIYNLHLVDIDATTNIQRIIQQYIANPNDDLWAELIVHKSRCIILCTNCVESYSRNDINPSTKLDMSIDIKKFN